MQLQLIVSLLILGSLAAILAFACPLSHMITLMNASHLLGIVVQAFHFIIMRCVPTAEQKEAGSKNQIAYLIPYNNSILRDSIEFFLNF